MQKKRFEAALERSDVDILCLSLHSSMMGSLLQCLTRFIALSLPLEAPLTKPAIVSTGKNDITCRPITRYMKERTVGPRMSPARFSL